MTVKLLMDENGAVYAGGQEVTQYAYHENLSDLLMEAIAEATNDAEGEYELRLSPGDNPYRKGSFRQSRYGVTLEESEDE